MKEGDRERREGTEVSSCRSQPTILLVVTCPRRRGGGGGEGGGGGGGGGNDETMGGRGREQWCRTGRNRRTGGRCTSLWVSAPPARALPYLARRAQRWARRGVERS
ncbi:hypothetical protein E2C01_086879 [Portunus trituberculatus]|uniref:Uncharacterized protein n=1 Tax=Portunus trituberculatus TaxID=210409 RepID=A0A5B7JAI0_PORTR|nr:hypothetical protein [Portunus trituberculatus]